MKIEGQLPAINSHGSAHITIDDIEDFFVLASMIRPGDVLFAPIRRKVTKVSKTGKSDTRQLLMKASIKVTEIEYQPNVEEMMVRGTLTQDIEGGKSGDFQRVLLEKGRPFQLQKFWDTFSIKELQKAADPTTDSTVSAIVMQSGISHICIIGRNVTVTVAKVEKAIPKVRYGSGNQEAKKIFFNLTAASFFEKVDVSQMKVVIIASPGFLQQEFLSFLLENKEKFSISGQEKKFIKATVSSGYPCELDTLLTSPEMKQHVFSLQVVQQATIWDIFLKALANSPKKTFVGRKKLTSLVEINAVDTLLVTNNFIFDLDINQRLEFLQIKDTIESNSKVVIFSSKHLSGEQLNELGGIAGLLKFEVDDDENLNFDDEN